MDGHEAVVFDIYFASITSMAHCHPGNGRSNGHATAPPAKSIEECAQLALDMIAVRRQIMERT